MEMPGVDIVVSKAANYQQVAKSLLEASRKKKSKLLD
jgi:hypothetical protein